MMWMTQEDGYLEVEQSFLIRPRFQWSVKLFGRLLCGSLTPPDLGLVEPIESQSKVTCPGCTGLLVPIWPPLVTVNLLLTAPDISGFAVGSYWTVGSTSACLPMIAFCIARPNYSAMAEVRSSISNRFAVIPALWGGSPNWLAPCWSKQNRCLCRAESLFFDGFSFRVFSIRVPWVMGKW